MDGSAQIVTSVSETLNKPGDSSRRRLAESGIDVGAFRESLMDFVVSTDGSSSADPLATKQRADVVKSLSAAPLDELTSGSMDKGLGLVDGLVGKSASIGGEMAEGAPESMLTSLGNLMKGTNAAAVTARRRMEEEIVEVRRRLSEAANGNLTNSTLNCSFGALYYNTSACAIPWEETPLAKAIKRADKLRNTTGNIGDVMVKRLIVGEEPVSVLSNDLSMRVGKSDPCKLENAFSAPGEAAAGGFALPAGTTCKPARRRILAERREQYIRRWSVAAFKPILAARSSSRAPAAAAGGDTDPVQTSFIAYNLIRSKQPQGDAWDGCQ